MLAVCCSHFSAPVDLGASIITGLIGNPVHTLCRQLLRRVGLSYQPAAFSPLLHFLTSHGAVFDSEGERVSAAVDERVESGIYNRALAGTDHYRHNCKANSEQHSVEAKHGIAIELSSHAHLPHAQHATQPPAENGSTLLKEGQAPVSEPGAVSAAVSQQQSGPVYEADRDRLRLHGGWGEALQMSLRTGMERAIGELHIDMTPQERVSTAHTATALWEPRL